MSKVCTLMGILLWVISTTAYAGSNLMDDAGVDLFNAPKVYTLVNLHPDEQNSRMYAVNYQLPNLLPLCSEVKLNKLNRKKLEFLVVETGKSYTYLYHKAAAEPFEKHLLLFFGTQCNKKAVAKLSKKDREGIKIGRAMIGMTKKGVLYAMGNPPRHVNPSLEAREWIYWRNRFKRTAISFDNKGKVTGIK